MEAIILQLTSEFGIQKWQTDNVIKLLDEVFAPEATGAACRTGIYHGAGCQCVDHLERGAWECLKTLLWVSIIPLTL